MGDRGSNISWRTGGGIEQSTGRKVDLSKSSSTSSQKCAFIHCVRLRLLSYDAQEANSIDGVHKQKQGNYNLAKGQLQQLQRKRMCVLVLSPGLASIDNSTEAIWQLET